MNIISGGVDFPARGHASRLLSSIFYACFSFPIFSPPPPRFFALVRCSSSVGRESNSLSEAKRRANSTRPQPAQSFALNCIKVGHLSFQTSRSTSTDVRRTYALLFLILKSYSWIVEAILPGDFIGWAAERVVPPTIAATPRLLHGARLRGLSMFLRARCNCD